MSSSIIISYSSFNIFLFTQVLTVLTTPLKYNEYITDKGNNISIYCDDNGSVIWFKRNEETNTSKMVQIGAILILSNIKESDAGIYVCVTTQTKTILNNEINVTNTYEEYIKSKIIVRAAPGPVTQLYFKASTILGFLIWRWNKTNSGGYPIRSFTAEYRYVSNYDNVTEPWVSLDPPNISPNVRQMEVYKLSTNSTYEFRIWANNRFGAGVIVSTQATTLPDTKEEDLVRLIKDDIENFDVRIWIAAVGVVLGSLVILAFGICVLMAVECYQSSTFAKGYEDGWDSMEVIPNIVLNPGFCDSDGVEIPFPRTIIFGEDDDSDGYDSDTVSSMEKPLDVFKRKVSVFFTGQTIRRM